MTRPMRMRSQRVLETQSETLSLYAAYFVVLLRLLILVVHGIDARA